MSPLKIEICLHYHCRVDDMPWVVSSGAPIVNETMAELMVAGLLTERATTPDDHQRYKPTGKLYAFAQMLEDTPLPIAPWIDPRTGRAVTCRRDPLPQQESP